MKRMLFRGLLTVISTLLLYGASAAANQTLTFVFLNSGAPEKARGFSKAELAEMQGRHVGNFGTQFNRGTLMSAGPLGDGGSIRGTVVLAVNTPEQIAECFKSDPYIQHEILEAEKHPWVTDVMKFGSPVVPFKLARHTLCIVKKGANWKPPTSGLTSESVIEWLPALKAMAQSGELAVSGPFSDAGEKLGVMVFYSTNQAQLKAELEKEQGVADGRFQLEFHSQFLGKGTLRDPREDLRPPARTKGIPIFDGKSFAGWDGDKGTWRIENQALVGGSLTEKVPHNDFIRTTKRYKNFELRLQMKLEGTGFVNGGVQLRSERSKEPAYEMVGYQADMGEGYWGCLYDESRRNKVLAHTHASVIKQLVKQNDWNDYVIRCEDAHIRLWLNGVLTVDYTEDNEKIPREGLIGLQIHGGGKATASYKDITIQELN